MTVTRQTPGSSSAELIVQLDQLKTSFDRRSSHLKASLLRRLGKSAVTGAADLEKYHDILCFLRAYPDSTSQLVTVEKELLQFGHRIEQFKIGKHDPNASKLADSGIVNSSVSHTFSYDLTRAVAKLYPGLVDIDWAEYKESDDANLIGFLPLLVAWQENDSIDNDPDYDIEAWLRTSGSPRSGRNSLAMVLHLLATSRLDHPTARALFENAQIPVRWTLTNCSASRTLKRLPAKATHIQTVPLLGRTSDLRKDLTRPARQLKVLSKSEGEVYVRAIKEVLGVRCRELFPLIGSNPAEVYRFMPGRGVEILIFGNNPDIRLPLESNFGAMLVRNGMPVGYGISAMLFERAEIAINVFPAYRSGESSFIIESFFHLFVKHFGARVLLVRSYQVGDDNEEAIESGSFWFYHKLGFRPIKSKVRELAEIEALKLARQKGYRTPAPVLRRLSKSDIFFHLDPKKTDSYSELSLPNLGYAVGNYVRDNFDGNRTAAVTASTRRVIRLLGIEDHRRWSANERIALDRMSPLVCCIPDLTRWSTADRKLLARIIRAKGSNRERDYARLTLQHARFRVAMTRLAEITKLPAS